MIDTLNNEIATKNIERLSKMSREEIEKEYKSTNKLALSNRDNIEQRVNDAFLKGEGLVDITVNGKIHKGLLFDENSMQSKMLREAGSFKAYYNKYLSCIKEIISEADNTKEIDNDTISKKLKTKLGKPDFSDLTEIPNYDYYGLMGGTQNIEVDFKITPTQNGEYNLETTMHINDWYGADKDDTINDLDNLEATERMSYTPLNTPILNTVGYYINYENPKNFIPGLDDFF